VTGTVVVVREDRFDDEGDSDRTVALVEGYRYVSFSKPRGCE
jgi:hypothetical protein